MLTFSSRLVWPLLGALGCAWLYSIHQSGLWPDFPLDFSVFWAAAIRVIQGDATLVYNGAAHNAFIAELYGSTTPTSLNFAYPPGVLLFIWPIGFLHSSAAWLALLAPPMLLFYWLISRLGGHLVALGMTFAIGGAIHSVQLGQNGFVTACLIGGGLLGLKHNKAFAGIAIGLLSLKPHLAPVAFLALLYWREWRALLWASATATMLIALPALVFGPEIWNAFLSGGTSFFDTISAKQENLIETMHQSVLAFAIRFTSPQGALVVQATVALAALTVCAQIRERDLAIAAVIAATLLFTPFLFLYDSTMLLVACAVVIRRDVALSIPLALLIATTGLWFLTLGSLVPIAAIGVLMLCFLLDRRMQKGRRSAPTPHELQTV